MMDNDKKALYTLIVHSENIAGTLNQITAVFTRRQINIESLNVSASSIKGVHKYTITAWTTEDVVEKVARQIEKKIDVIQAHYFKDEDIFQREIALYKVSTPEFQNSPEPSRVIRHYSAHIVEVNPVFSIVEMSGSSDDITRASSIGTMAVPILWMGASPMACLRAFPSVMAASSMMWWSLSPDASILRSNPAYLARVSVMCLRNWMSHVTSNFPLPSMSRSTETLVSLVLRSIEDDLLITENGCRLLGHKRLPHTVEEVETEMAAR